MKNYFLVMICLASAVTAGAWVYSTTVSAPGSVQSGVEYEVHGEAYRDNTDGDMGLVLYKDGTYFTDNTDYLDHCYLHQYVTDYGSKTVQYDLYAYDSYSSETVTAYVQITMPQQAPIGTFESVSDAVTLGQNVTASGWAADFEMGAPVSHVDFYIDGNYSGQASLGGSRPDIQAAKSSLGAGWATCPHDLTNSGWNIAVGTGGLATGDHSLKVVAYDAQGQSTELGTKTFSVIFIYAQQSINFPNPGNQTLGHSLTLSATALSGLPVSYTVVAGPATLGGSTLAFSSLGSVTIMASQAGNGTYAAAANVSQTFTVEDGDDDGDGISNSMEILLGSNPSQGGGTDNYLKVHKP